MKKISIFICFLFCFISLKGMEKSLEGLTPFELVNRLIEVQDEKFLKFKEQLEEELKESFEVILNKFNTLQELYEEDLNEIFNEIITFLKSPINDLDEKKVNKIFYKIQNIFNKNSKTKIINLKKRLKKLEKRRNPKIMLFFIITCSYVLLRYLEYLVKDSLSKYSPNPS